MVRNSVDAGEELGGLVVAEPLALTFVHKTAYVVSATRGVVTFVNVDSKVFKESSVLSLPIGVKTTTGLASNATHFFLTDGSATLFILDSSFRFFLFGL